uniref:Pre-mRNA-processing factor 39 n=1 Tax=Nothoprocta perdicaria TaxID=30464 RepID=A0A8C7EHI0_NOTPE
MELILPFPRREEPIPGIWGGRHSQKPPFPKSHHHSQSHTVIPKSPHSQSHRSQTPPFPKSPFPNAAFPPQKKTFWEAPALLLGMLARRSVGNRGNHLPAARKAFDAFFSRYPYCYGYWKKYADMERRGGCVFERGLQSIPLSMDLWIHYISFLQSTLDPGDPESVQKIRGWVTVFEAAVAAAGMDFRSDRLWELYVEWERAQGELRAVTALFDRLLSMPTQLYSHHWERFKEHVLHNPPRDILTPEELLWLRSKLAAEPLPKEPEPGAAEEQIRELVISMRQQIHAQNEAEVGKRWNFEEGIKRPYFHVKPLERAQLRNWRDYLDYELAAGSHERIIVLFERCVIACALYEEFWVKYTRYLERHTVAGARSVFQRACGYHLPRKPNIHLLWAAFEEKQGESPETAPNRPETHPETPKTPQNTPKAPQNVPKCSQNTPEALLREAAASTPAPPLASFYAVKLARQVLKVQKNLIKARKVLVEALDRDPENARLYANLLEMECGADVRQNEGNAMSCFERALRSGLPDEAKVVFSQRRVEFLEDFGSSIHSLLTAYDEHQKFLKQRAARKRPPENG